MRLSVWLLVVSVACHHNHREVREADDDHPCDPKGLPEDRTPEFEQSYVARQLFADEVAARDRCKLPEITIGEDDAVKARCAAIEGPCRRVCLITGREKVALALYDLILNGLRGFRTPAACLTTLPVGRTNLRGDDAMRLWHCLGPEPLPRRMEIDVTLAPNRSLTQIVVHGALIPNGGDYAFIYGEVDVGCGLRTFGVLVSEPGGE